MSDTFTTIKVANEAGVMTITLNRPDALNAFNAQMSVELAAACKTAERDKQVRCVVLTGAGRAFCSGQDLAEIQGRYQSEPPTEVDFAAHLRSKFNPIVARLRTLEKPVIAAINGAAAGAGASFALACDLKLAAASSYLMMAFVHVGLVPDSGATISLVQAMGLTRAAEMCFLGQKLPAEEAQRCGLVNRVVQDEQLMDEAHALARKLAAMPTRAIGLTKRALNKAWTSTFEEQLEYEAFLQQTAGNTADHREGVKAFIEKRKPSFGGA